MIGTAGSCTASEQERCAWLCRARPPAPGSPRPAHDRRQPRSSSSRTRPQPPRRATALSALYRASHMAAPAFRLSVRYDRLVRFRLLVVYGVVSSPACFHCTRRLWLCLPARAARPCSAALHPAIAGSRPSDRAPVIRPSRSEAARRSLEQGTASYARVPDRRTRSRPDFSSGFVPVVDRCHLLSEAQCYVECRLRWVANGDASSRLSGQPMKADGQAKKIGKICWGTLFKGGFCSRTLKNMVFAQRH